MSLRKLLLRIMLFALAGAACSGVLALFVRYDFTWRLAGMGAVAAVAAAIMIPMSGMVDDRKTRAAGLLGMSLCVVEFVLAVALIWSDIISSRAQEFTALSMLMLLLTGLPAVVCMRMTGSSDSRVGGLLGIAGMGAALVCLLVASGESAFSFSGVRDEKWWMTGWFSIYFPSLLIGMCLVGFARPDGRAWRWIGVAGAAAASAIAAYGIWIHSGDNPIILSIAYSVAGVAAHALLCLRLQIPDSAAWVRIGTILAAAATGALICATVYSEGDFNDRLGFWRFATGTGIVAASGTIALLVLGKLSRRVDVERAASDISQITVICPRCRRRLPLPIGGGTCPGCRLRIKVTVENTRCTKCDYDLTGITADKCPECGTRIDQTPTTASSPEPSTSLPHHP